MSCWSLSGGNKGKIITVSCSLTKGSTFLSPPALIIAAHFLGGFKPKCYNVFKDKQQQLQACGFQKRKVLSFSKLPFFLFAPLMTSRFAVALAVQSTNLRNVLRVKFYLNEASRVIFSGPHVPQPKPGSNC